MQKLPDGSSFFIASMPLPKDHWIYEPTGEPPAEFSSLNEDAKKVLAVLIEKAARYAIKGATMSGKEMDFDPDALIQNLKVGFFGLKDVK